MKYSREKVAAALVMIINAFGFKKKRNNQFDLDMSFRELANFATIAFPTLIRVLNALKHEGVLAIKKEELFVLDETALRKLARLET